MPPIMSCSPCSLAMATVFSAPATPHLASLMLSTFAIPPSAIRRASVALRQLSSAATGTPKETTQKPSG